VIVAVWLTESRTFTNVAIINPNLEVGVARSNVVRGRESWAAALLALGAMVACGSSSLGGGGGRGGSGGTGDGTGGAVGGAAGGGGGSNQPAPGGGCALNSDCLAPFLCAFQLCHSACVATGDCPNGQLCVKSSTVVGDASAVDVCQLPAESRCDSHSPCMAPLICAHDEMCRGQCQKSSDCVPSQVCTTSGVCALISQLVPGTNDVPSVGNSGDAGPPDR
jgi:hypothetical protein